MVPRRNELRLGSPEAATGSWARPLGLAGAADRGGDRRGPRDGSWLFAGRWDPGACSRAARRTGGKTSHFRRGVHRLHAGKSSYLWNGVDPRGEPGAHACAECQRLRTVSRADCRGPGARAERGRDLARPGRRSRLLRAVRECAALCREIARRGACRGARRHHDRAGRRRPGRLRRRRSDGPPTAVRGSTAGRGSSS